ncbi:hypothetical protein [Stutzerimonas nitrititolerans]|uniref:hypothetical protein n=1 Tax=Stutzerimonas nitrititolerans TaxID=2482751 RepID=UPI0028A6E4B4|nr:hypothetical protein [Stutzerimonas nitrititolerans]
MARAYHRDQPGAPALTYTPAPTSQAHFDAFKTILIAALVSGYGELPAAGWELVFESPSSLVLRNGTRSGYVCFQRSTTVEVVVTVWLAETFSGVDAEGKIIGDGVRSGTAANSAEPQRFTVRSLAAYSSSSTWALVADEGGFVLSMSGDASSTAGVIEGSYGYQYQANGALYCGDDSAGDFICVGGVNTTAVGVSNGVAGFGAGGFTALKYPDSGLLVDTSAIDVAMPGTRAAVAAVYNSHPAGVILPTAHLAPLSWVANQTVRDLRGCAVDHRLTAVYNSPASQALGGPALTSRSMNTVLDLGDGHAYFVARSYFVSAITMLLTDNPEFW